MPLPAGLFLLTGCVCTKYVDNMGKTTPVFDIRQTWSDSAGNIVFEGMLYRRPLNDFHSPEPVGRRYLILNEPEVRDKIITRTISRKDNDRNIQLYAPINIFPGLSEDKLRALDVWYLYPPDIINKVDNARPPEYIKSAKAKKLLYNYADFKLPYKIDDTTYYLDINTKFSDKDNIHMADWAYPCKILFVPAFVLDVISSPVQLVIEVDKLIKTH